MNVLVYSGTGTTTESVKHCIESLRFHLSPYYAVVTINETSILNDPWMYKTSMLVIPGGADLPYCNVLNGEGNRKILSFIKKGGKFLGLCAGGYYGSSFVEWEKGTPREVSGRRELGLFQGTAKGCTFSGFEYNSHVGARIVPLEVNTDVLAECPSTVYNYYNGGGTFLNASRVKNCTVLARYVDPEVGDDDNAAVVLCQVGKGTALLSGTHPEFSLWLMKPGAEESHYRDIAHQLSAHDTSRKVFLKQCLEQLGLKVNNDVNAPLIPKLSPIFIASNNPFNTKKLADDLAHNLELVDGNKFEDDNDTLVFHRQSTGLNYLNDSPDDDDVNHIPKHINFCDEGLPDAKTTPFFNMKTYFAHMNNYNSSSSSSNNNGPIGSILAYGDNGCIVLEIEMAIGDPT
jgi:biotin--protein ligase